MYPNPQDVLPLPPQPDLAHYRKRAKELVKAGNGGTPDVVREWSRRWVHDLATLRSDREGPPHTRVGDRYADLIADFARERFEAAGCTLTQAQFVIARAHGFESWPKFARHLASLEGTRTPVAAFEETVDAIVAGDRATVDRLLHTTPDLVHAHSSRDHRATLLHYVAANGVENFRQVTPPNIVEIARILLDAGAEVDAEADIYGGGSTTLGLVITSAHPRGAGVQNDLADLLLERGARIDPRSVHYCLMNGCPEAAEYLAGKGLPIGLKDAAGIGNLDLVERHYDESRSLSDSSWRREVGAALMMAIWYDRGDVVAVLLDRGFDPGWMVEGHGENRTALHVAAHQGRVGLVELLLERGAPVNANDAIHDTPPIVWALHAWLVEGRGDEEPYRRVTRMLAEAGATVRADWIDDDRVRADADLFAALKDRITER